VFSLKLGAHDAPPDSLVVWGEGQTLEMTKRRNKFGKKLSISLTFTIAIVADFSNFNPSLSIFIFHFTCMNDDLPIDLTLYYFFT